MMGVDAGRLSRLLNSKGGAQWRARDVKAAAGALDVTAAYLMSGVR